MILLASKIANLKGVTGCDIALLEIDTKVQNVKITIEGTDLSYDKITDIIHEYGASIHSIDKVSTGSRIVEELLTPQDRRYK
jgi:hypothetical protein